MRADALDTGAVHATVAQRCESIVPIIRPTLERPLFPSAHAKVTVLGCGRPQVDVAIGERCGSAYVTPDESGDLRPR